MKSQLDRRIEIAQQEADAARAQVLSTLDAVRRRVDPRVIASEAVEQIFASLNKALIETTEAAKSRPWLVGLGATLFGLLIALGAKIAGDTGETTKPTPADES